MDSYKKIVVPRKLPKKKKISKPPQKISTIQLFQLEKKKNSRVVDQVIIIADILHCLKETLLL